MLRKCCSLDMNMRADERSFRFLFFIAKETKVYICTTGTLRITNSSSDTNLDEGSVCTSKGISAEVWKFFFDSWYHIHYGP
jgi:hypothetical protein